MKATPLCEGEFGDVVKVSCVAVLLVRVTVAVVDVKPVALKVSVTAPAGPPTPRFVKAATPKPFVVAVALPTSKYPLGTDAVTTTLACGTLFPLASRS